VQSIGEKNKSILMRDPNSTPTILTAPLAFNEQHFPPLSRAGRGIDAKGMKSMKTPSAARRGIDRHHAYIDLIKIDLESRNGIFGKDTQDPGD